MSATLTELQAATVENTGLFASTSSRILLWFSGAVWVAESTEVGLQPGESKTVVFTVDIPHERGMIRENNHILEVFSSSDNEEKFISVAYADLTVLSLDVPDAVVPRDSVTVTASIENTGSFATTSSMVRLELTGDIQGYFENKYVGIDAGETVDVEFVVEIPDERGLLGMDQSYEFVVYTN